MGAMFPFDDPNARTEIPGSRTAVMMDDLLYPVPARKVRIVRTGPLTQFQCQVCGKIFDDRRAALSCSHARIS